SGVDPGGGARAVAPPGTCGARSDRPGREGGGPDRGEVTGEPVRTGPAAGPALPGGDRAGCEGGVASGQEAPAWDEPDRPGAGGTGGAGPPRPGGEGGCAVADRPVGARGGRQGARGGLCHGGCDRRGCEAGRHSPPGTGRTAAFARS